MMTILLIIFIALQIADAVTTIYGAHIGVDEANPVMRFVFGKVGLYGGLFLMKVPITAIISYIVLSGQAGFTFILLLVIPFTVILLNNLYCIYKVKQLNKY